MTTYENGIPPQPIPTRNSAQLDDSKNTCEITCDKCGGSGSIEILVDSTPLKYGENEIGKDWSKIENVWIWFQAFNKPTSWRGIPGYVYETSTGDYLAPFRGELIKVIKDTKNEYRQVE